MTQSKKILLTIDVISAVLVVAAAIMVFFYAPIEAVMGLVQKVFYFHVATAWTGMLAFLAALVTAIAYLATKRRIWDLAGVAAIEIGLVFMLICIISGSIWARPAWNTWWTWDPRLTTVTIMELVYLAYLMLRQGVEDPERRARFGAVYAIVGFISVPMTFFSIRFFRTIHPVVVAAGDPGATGSFNMTPPMLQTFMVSLVAFSFLFVSLFWHRLNLGKRADALEQKKLKLMQS